MIPDAGMIIKEKHDLKPADDLEKEVMMIAATPNGSMTEFLNEIEEEPMIEDGVEIEVPTPTDEIETCPSELSEGVAAYAMPAYQMQSLSNPYQRAATGGMMNLQPLKQDPRLMQRQVSQQEQFNMQPSWD